MYTVYIVQVHTDSRKYLMCVSVYTHDKHIAHLCISKTMGPEFKHFIEVTILFIIIYKTFSVFNILLTSFKAFKHNLEFPNNLNNMQDIY